MAFSGTSLRSRVPIAYITGAGTAITNTTTKTSLLTGITMAGPWVSGNVLTIPANSIVAGQVLRIELFGAFSAINLASSTPYFEILLGSTTIAKGTGVAFGSTSSGLIWNTNWSGGYFILTAAGASGSIIGYQTAGFIGNQVFPLTGSGAINAAPSAVSIATNAVLAFGLNFQWGVANASLSIQLTGGRFILD